MVSTPDLVRYLDGLLEASAIKDYCPNGLQVEGAPVISRAVFAVTASLAVIEQAAAEGAQALIVHHAGSGVARIRGSSGRGDGASRGCWGPTST
jgi:putative NIF3 family GTP cyclohydrolase 1 type 2